MSKVIDTLGHAYFGDLCTDLTDFARICAKIFYLFGVVCQVCPLFIFFSAHIDLFQTRFWSALQPNPKKFGANKQILCLDLLWIERLSSSKTHLGALSRSYQSLNRTSAKHVLFGTDKTKFLCLDLFYRLKGWVRQKTHYAEGASLTPISDYAILLSRTNLTFLFQIFIIIFVRLCDKSLVVLLVELISINFNIFMHRQWKCY